MHIQVYLQALAVACVSATEIQRSGRFGVRPHADADPVDSPSAPIYHSTGDDVPYTGSTTHLGDDVQEPTTPEYELAPQPNECLRASCAELTQELAMELIDQLVNNVGGSPGSTTSQLVPDGGFGTQVQPPIVTVAATRSPIPNVDVAKTMTLAQEEIALFDAEEQDLYFNDPLCFYANVERKYASVATTSPSESS